MTYRVYCDDDLEKLAEKQRNVPQGGCCKVKVVPSGLQFIFPVRFGNGVVVGSTCRFYDTVRFGNNCMLLPGSTFTGQIVVMGKNCTMGAGSIIEGTLSVGPGLNIQEWCWIDDMHAPLGDRTLRVVGDSVRILTKPDEGRMIERYSVLVPGRSVVREWVGSCALMCLNTERGILVKIDHSSYLQLEELPRRIRGIRTRDRREILSFCDGLKQEWLGYTP